MSLRLFAAAVLACLVAAALAAPAQAQTVYRKDVPPGVATPTNGTFSIKFPVPFTDTEMKAEDPPAPPAIVRLLTGINSDGVMFSASETPMLGLEPRPMEDFMEATRKRPGAIVSDAHHDNADGMDILAFDLDDNSGGYFFRIIRHHNVQYMQVIQFPKTERPQAEAVRNDFFGSFKIGKP
jgi:hypothetical protein